MGLIFDREHATRITEARVASLGSWLPSLLRELEAKTALDVGCGVGYFARWLADEGLDVLGIDAREANVAAARERHPDIRFSVGDITDPSVRALGTFDLVLCVGVMYHLEDPFAAVRNMAALARRILVIESMVMPDRSPAALLVDEGPAEDQSLRSIAFIPSEAALTKMLHAAGLASAYRLTTLPDHEDFRSTLTSVRKRTILAATTAPLARPYLRPLPRRLTANPWERPFVRIGRFARKPTPEKLLTIRRLLGR